MASTVGLAVPKLLRKLSSPHRTQKVHSTCFPNCPVTFRSIDLSIYFCLLANNYQAIAGSWAAPFTLYYLFLSGRIVAQRLKTEVFIGDTSTSVHFTLQSLC
jgi:hypothetical protein